MKKQAHQYRTTVQWQGNLGKGTSSYTSYSRDHLLQADGRPPVLLSSDPSFRGDPSRYNPEELLLASLSGCHMLWFLHLCADAGVVVTHYEDNASGTMETDPDGSGRFTAVHLHPRVACTGEVSEEILAQLHREAHQKCFIAASVNFPVICLPDTMKSP